jgi:hypothetical protein
MTDTKLDQAISDWLEAEAPGQVPDRVLRVTLERTRTMSQRVGWLGLAGKSGLPRLMPALTGSVIVLVVAALALGVYFNNSGSGVEPSPTPSPSPTPAHLPASLSDWTRVTLDFGSEAGHVAEIAAGPRGIVAVAREDSSGQYRFFFSADGVEWTATDSPPATGEYVSLVANEAGFLVIVSEQGAWTSPNGIDWQRAAANWTGNPDLGGSIVVDAVAGGPGYVAVGNHNTIWYSTDGSEWNAAEVPAPPPLTTPEFPDLTVDISHVVATADHLVATGYYATENSDGGGISQDFVLESSDGRAWRRVLRSVGDGAGVMAIAAGPTGFLAIGGHPDNESTSPVWQSADGATWRDLGNSDFSSALFSGLATTSAGHVAVGYLRPGDFDPRPALLWTSADGQSWSEMPRGEPFNLREPGTALSSVIPFGSRFLVAGQRDGQPTIWVSAPE